MHTGFTESIAKSMQHGLPWRQAVTSHTLAVMMYQSAQVHLVICMTCLRFLVASSCRGCVGVAARVWAAAEQLSIHHLKLCARAMPLRFITVEQAVLKAV